MAFVYWIVTHFMNFWYRFWFGAKISGIENIPDEGAFVLCGNHISAHDAVFVASFCKRKLKFLAKKEIFIKGFAGLIKKLGGIPVDRGNNDIGAVKASLRVLKNGDPLLIFPQGTRCTELKEEDFKNGAGFMAIKTQVPVIPFAICGKYKVRGGLKFKVGKPISTEGLLPNNENISGTIFKSIEELVNND